MITAKLIIISKETNELIAKEYNETFPNRKVLTKEFCDTITLKINDTVDSFIKRTTPTHEETFGYKISKIHIDEEELKLKAKTINGDIIVSKFDCIVIKCDRELLNKFIDNDVISIDGWDIE